MWSLTSKAVLLLAAVLLCGCLRMNEGDNGFPQGYELTGVGPYEEAPFQLCDQDGALWTKTAMAIPAAAGAAMQSCVTDDDCDGRQRCQCGRCVPRYCTSLSSFMTCGLRNCADSHCLSVCDPEVPGNPCGDGFVCSVTENVCRPLCVADDDCLPGEQCRQTGDGMACVVNRWDDGYGSQGFEPLSLANGLEPLRPSGRVEDDGGHLVLWFVAKSDQGAALYQAVMDTPPLDWRSLYAFADSSQPLLVLDDRADLATVSLVANRQIMAYARDGAVVLAAMDAPGEDLAVVEAGNSFTGLSSPYLLKRGDGSLWLFITARDAQNQPVLVRAGAADLTGPWTLDPTPILTIGDVETRDGVFGDICYTDVNCAAGLYCMRTDDKRCGQCVTATCQKNEDCDRGLVCNTQGVCVCGVEDCPDPNIQPIWVGLTTLGDPFVFEEPATGILRLFFTAFGRLSAGQTGADYSIGLVSISPDGALTPARGNPVFDRKFLITHFDEREPAIVRTGDNFILFYRGDNTIKAGRTPIKPLIDFD